MPNWCYNEVEISGPRDEMLRLLDKCGFKDNKFSFNGIRPLPTDLVGIISGIIKVDGVEYESWREIDGNKIPIYADELATLKEKHGAADWYDWCYINWGVKWDSSCVDYLFNDVDKGHEDIEVSVMFETAWGPPDALYDFILKEYPNISWDWFYKEPAMRFAGWLGGEL